MLFLSFYIAYYLVAFFYVASGILLLLYPKAIEHKLKDLFPLLVSFRYSHTVTSLNLIGVGCGLLFIAKAISELSPIGIFSALILSAFEVYLGVKFYYFEERNVSQAIIHLILHLIIVFVIGWFLLTKFSSTITLVQLKATAVLSQ